MTRDVYHKALQNLQDEVLAMGKMVSIAIQKSVESLQKRDKQAAKEIIASDIYINKKRFEIEEKCIFLIATQQPMAVDLRTLTSILSIVTDLERMGDHAEGIAKINLLIGDEPLVKPLIDIPRMAELGLSMLDKCLKAFVSRDIEAARFICNEDDKVDALHDQIYRELLLLMIQNPRII
ncbi:MAG: phosphate signaling complex protein PhoU, partial [Candidatus Jettenia caeni]|nr:phosphate signaling complex protein PhoU [Candidatus Jettenia caeni]